MSLHGREVTQFGFEQGQSPLYSALPAELRLAVLRYCLSVCNHPTSQFNRDSIWRRLDYDRPQIVHTSILRTCRRLHDEGLRVLDQNLDYTIFFTAPPERPPQCTNPFDLERRLQDLAQQGRRPSVRNLQVFANLALLESTRSLQDLLDIEHLHPRNVTLAIRHVDFRDWEHDAPLAINSVWVSQTRLPNSVRTVVVQIESLGRKTQQLDHIAKIASRSWTFQRKDGTLLAVNPTRTTTQQWQGRSTLNDKKWVRDETAPHQLSYHLISLHFIPTGDPSFTRPRPEDLSVPAEMAKSLLHMAPSIRVADKQFHRMLTRHTNAIFAGSQHGGFLTMCPGSWPGDASRRSGSVEEMDPTWLFPKLDWLLMEPEDARFGGRVTGYYHQDRVQRSRCSSING
ncbi:hypothetical protein BDZ85DRAFT_267593 [Elsinoe ampelina]|uniref:F-box domain-containing protein n=1 Tax=Elsinoe ampelina TaxID=302913 RepID=A0A6A6G400_9PEZI|nr:hypothetical protein BDZ85DRAFT_267593 [Elsinoe ampelina]